ncbi:hypothetical protein [Streptomyces triticisoli]|uniref:hypothetical protein n=1 Tax=Streptomyces triticisoli TaxID=2182797 RepID=UPI000DDA35AF|nr:hypothetical protein [Streptomyces triticisoli]
MRPPHPTAGPASGGTRRRVREHPAGESYIERTHGSCDDDGHADALALRWKYDDARPVLNGRSTRLVKDDSAGQ